MDYQDQDILSQSSTLDESNPLHIQDLYLANNYTGPMDVKYTRHDILNLDQRYIDKFQKLFGFTPSNLDIDRQRILRILTHLDLIYDQSEALLEPTLRQTLCETLPLDDLYNLKQVYKLDKLDCMIPVTDKDGKITHISGLTNISYRVIKSINENGTIETIYSGIRNNNPKWVNIIIQNTSDKNILKTRVGSEPYLNVAVTDGGIEIVRYLIEHLDLGLELDSPVVRYNPLYSAAQKGYIEMADLLIQNGVIIGDYDFIGAIISGSPDMVKYFIDQGFDVNTVLKSVDSPMIHFVLDPELNESEAIQIVKILIEAGADPNVSSYGNPLIHQAILKGWPDLVNYLIGLEQINLGIRDSGGNEVINELVTYTNHKADYRQAIEETLDRGVDVNHKSNRGETPLDRAIFEYLNLQYEHFGEVIEILLDYGADVNLIPVKVIDEIFEYVDPNTEIIHVLLEDGLDPNIHDGILLDKTIQYYSRNPHPKTWELIQTLLKNGADIPDDRVREYLVEIGAM